MIMNEKIVFSDFVIKPGRVEVFYEEENCVTRHIIESGRLWFELEPAIFPENNLIALSLATLCGRRFSNIKIDLPISKYTVDEIANYTEASIQAPTGSDFKLEIASGVTTLNFSGGFDSLSAKCLMPDSTKLVSMDLGGHFSRERFFFEKFSPCIVKTNLVETNLRANSWAFMGIASLLYRNYLKTEFQTFGNILEASTFNFSSKVERPKIHNFPLFISAKIFSAPYVLGLTEIGTLKVLSHYKPELISDSLTSLASPGDEKYYRKFILSSIAEDRYHKNFNLPANEQPNQPFFSFGQRFAPDFLNFYVIKHAGVDVASHSIKNIPDEVVRIAKSLSLDFYEKFNPKFILNFPATLKDSLILKLVNAGIVAYSPEDWKEFSIICKFLARYYPID